MNREKITVYGAGVIGACQATLCIGNGFPTTVIGHSSAGMERCRNTILQNWDDLIAEGLATEENKEAALSLLTLSSQPADMAGSAFVFEAVSEDLDIKREVYQLMEAHCGEDTVIASCTSSIDAEVLAGLFRHPERFLIAHPFQPVHMLPLVELVCHSATAPEALERARTLLSALKRQVVVLKKSVPGFLVNRFAQALFRESIYLMEQGVTTAADIDLAVKYAMGMRYASIGLLEYFDDVGFALETAIARNIYPDLCDVKTPPQPLVAAGLASGKTGRAAGAGLHDWSTIDPADYRRRKQAPYFDGVREWDLPTRA